MLSPEEIRETGMYKVVDKAGGVSALAKVLGVTRQACYLWLQRGFAPPIRAIQLEEMYGVPRSELMDPVLLHGSLKDATSANAHRPYLPRKFV